MDKHLHIISLDVPWPANYGGVVDIFHKIVALHQCGVKIHLHCYSSTRAPQDELDKYCASVNYYARKVFPAAFALGLPYIVSSRNDKRLLQNLLEDDHPVFMEGIHCTYLLDNGALRGRRVFVRPHNVEFRYYAKLAAAEKNIFRKIYFQAESWLLKRYEKRIANKATFWPLSVNDLLVYQTAFTARDSELLPAFVPWHDVSTPTVKGCFCLYHGNLSVNENERAVEWLLKEVFNDLSIPFVIAGHNPSPGLEKLVHSNSSCCLVSNPSDTELQDMIRKAQVNVLPSFNNTGVKLKLLNALYNGKFCLVNTAAVAGAGIDGLCEIADSPEAFKAAAQLLYQQPYPAETADTRQRLLHAHYDNEKNARQIIDWIY